MNGLEMFACLLLLRILNPVNAWYLYKVVLLVVCILSSAGLSLAGFSSTSLHFPPVTFLLDLDLTSSSRSRLCPLPDNDY